MQDGTSVTKTQTKLNANKENSFERSSRDGDGDGDGDGNDDRSVESVCNPSSSPLPSPWASKAQVQVQAWLMDQTARSSDSSDIRDDGHPHSSHPYSIHSHSHFHQSQSQSQSYNSFSTLAPIKTSSSSSRPFLSRSSSHQNPSTLAFSTPPPPFLAAQSSNLHPSSFPSSSNHPPLKEKENVYDQSVLPPVSHGHDVWTQLYDAMHVENQKLRTRLAQAEKKADTFAKENQKLRQKIQSLSAELSDPSRSIAASSSSRQSSSNPQLPFRSTDSTGFQVTTPNIASSNSRDASSPNIYQLPSGFSVSSHSPAPSNRRSSAFESDSDRKGSSSLGSSSSGTGGRFAPGNPFFGFSRVNKEDTSGRRQDAGDRKGNDLDQDHNDRNNLSTSPGRSKGQDISSSESFETASGHPFEVLSQMESATDAQSRNRQPQPHPSKSNPRPQSRSFNTVTPNQYGAGWHNHGLSGFDMGSSRLTWAQAGELEQGGDDSPLNAIKSPARKFELHMPRAREKGKGKEDPKRIGSEDLDDSRDQAAAVSVDQPTSRQRQEMDRPRRGTDSNIDSWAASIRIPSKLVATQTSDQISSGTSAFSNPPSSDREPAELDSDPEASELPNTSLGALVSAHVAHLNDTMPYATLEKDRLERILASSSSGGSSLGNRNNDCGGFGMERGFGKSQSSNGNSDPDSRENEMSRSISKSESISEEPLEPCIEEDEINTSLRDRGSLPILTSVPLSENQASSQEQPPAVPTARPRIDLESLSLDDASRLEDDSADST